MRNCFILFVSFLLMAFAMGVKNEICNLPTAADGDGGRVCLAYIPSFSYNPRTNACESFTYGGCGGNANRFVSRKECEEKCKD